MPSVCIIMLLIDNGLCLLPLYYPTEEHNVDYLFLASLTMWLILAVESLITGPRTSGFQLMEVVLVAIGLAYAVSVHVHPKVMKQPASCHSCTSQTASLSQQTKAQPDEAQTPSIWTYLIQK